MPMRAQSTAARCMAPRLPDRLAGIERASHAAEEVAHVIVFLCSEAASYVNGGSGTHV